MHGFVDIHCHALPGVDDGATSVDMGLDMLRRAAEEGVDDVVLTPHFRADDGAQRSQQLQDCFAQFADAVDSAGIGVRVHLGAELGFRFGLAQLIGSSPATRLAGGSYSLVDLPPGPLSPGLEQAFFEVRAAGYRPILAHPERHRNLATDPDRIDRLRAQDLLVQVNAGSLRGRFGRRAQAAAIRLAESGKADFIGSDGHDLDKRPPSLRSAYEQVVELAGPEEAQRLFVHNPRCVLTGTPVQEGQPTLTRERPGMWARLRRRLGR
jgi:protein-tyrosine phosphatase